MGFASTKTFYRPIVESCEEADARGAPSDQLRARTEQKIGKFLTCVWRITDFPRISNSPHTGSTTGR